MQIDPFPVRLEQELKYALAYAALVSAAANGRLLSLIHISEPTRPY